MREECGVFGIYNLNKFDTARTVYYALFALQHRGQESCGIAIQSESGSTNCIKDMGLVSEVFDDSTLSNLQGFAAIGHVRYSAPALCNRENAQPLTTKYLMGSFSICQNGNIFNADELRSELEAQGAIFQTNSDTEVIAYMLARERIKNDSLEDSIKIVMSKLRGSYCLLIMVPEKIIAVRDPLGVRPLSIGKVEDSYCFASETCAFDAIGAEYVRDVAPGEIVSISEGVLKQTDSGLSTCSAACIFEHIYFARPDSVIDGQSVYESRLNAGKILAQESNAIGDIVIGVPDSGIVSAIGYSQAAGIPYGEGLIKNRYIGRTFIQPAQGTREKSIKMKLSALRRNIEGKRVIMVDDSIVRGSTIRQIVSLLKSAGAKEVHVRISSPQFLWACYFGTDITDRNQLISVTHSPEEIMKQIGADSLQFMPLDRVTEIAPNSKLDFCRACFSGKYPVPVPSQT